MQRQYFKMGSLFTVLIIITLLASAGDAALARPLAVSPAIVTGQVGLATGGGVLFWQNPLPQGNGLNDIECRSTTLCVAVGNSGTTLRTLDGGATWETRPATGNLGDFNGLTCISVSNCIAVGDTGSIARSINVTSINGWSWINEKIPGSTTIFISV